MLADPNSAGHRRQPEQTATAARCHAQISEDIGDLKARMSSLESSMVAVKREVHNGEEVDARQQVSLDKIVRRIERLEARLEIA